MRKFNIVEAPQTVSYMLTHFNDEEFKRGLKERNLIVEVNNITKTRYSTSIYTTSDQGEQISRTVNFEVPGVKTHEQTKRSMRSGNVSVCHYFKKMKSQGQEEYIKYVDAMLDQLGVPADKEVSVRDTYKFRSLAQ